MRRTMIPAAIAAILAAAPAAAHHSVSAEFETDRNAELTGEVTNVWYSNPHVRYRIRVQTEDGSFEDWDLHMGNIASLRRAGWLRDTLEVGDVVTASGNVGRNDTKKLNVGINSVTRTDGSRLIAAAPAGARGRARGPDPRDRTDITGDDFTYGMLNKDHPIDITGPWTNAYRFRVTVDDLEPKPTPFKPEVQAVYEATEERYEDYSLRCLAPGLPRIFGAPYNMEIVDAGSHYLMVHEEHNTPRRVYMDGRTPPEDTPASAMGYSVGRWENDNVLVIETTHLLPGWLDGSGLPMSGDGTRTVERWEVSENRMVIDRTMTIYDPNYTAPLTRRRASARGEDIVIREMDSCDPQGYYRDLLESGRLDAHLNQ